MYHGAGSFGLTPLPCPTSLMPMTHTQEGGGGHSIICFYRALPSSPTTGPRFTRHHSFTSSCLLAELPNHLCLLVGALTSSHKTLVLPLSPELFLSDPSLPSLSSLSPSRPKLLFTGLLVTLYTTEGQNSSFQKLVTTHSTESVPFQRSLGISILYGNE